MINTYDGGAVPTGNHPMNIYAPPLCVVLEHVLQANAAAFPPFQIPQPCNLITGDIDIDGYGGSDVVSAFCNNDGDGTAGGSTNYNTSYGTKIPGTGNVATVPAEFLSDGFVRFGLPVAKGRSVKFSVGNNNNGKTHVFNSTVAIGTGVAATAPTVHIYCQGEWTGIVPITKLTFVTAGGATMLKGSSIRLYCWKQELNSNPGLF